MVLLRGSDVVPVIVCVFVCACTCRVDFAQLCIHCVISYTVACVFSDVTLTRYFILFFSVRFSIILHSLALLNERCRRNTRWARVAQN